MPNYEEFCVECGLLEALCECEGGFKVCQVGEWRADRLLANGGRMFGVLVNREEYAEWQEHLKNRPKIKSAREIFDDWNRVFSELKDHLKKATGIEIREETEEEKAEKKRLEVEREFENLRAWKRARLEGKK